MNCHLLLIFDYEGNILDMHQIKKFESFKFINFSIYKIKSGQLYQSFNKMDLELLNNLDDDLPNTIVVRQNR